MKREILHCLIAFGIAMTVDIAFIYLAGWIGWKIHFLVAVVIGSATYSVTYLGVTLLAN